MQRVKHEIPDAYRDMTIDELAERQAVRYGELEPDWDAFRGFADRGPPQGAVPPDRRRRLRQGRPARPAGGRVYAVDADRPAGPGRFSPHP